MGAELLLSGRDIGRLEAVKSDDGPVVDSLLEEAILLIVVNADDVENADNDDEAALKLIVDNEFM